MKSSLMIIAIFLSIASAGIGENFERGGVWLGGDGFVKLRDLGSENSDLMFSFGLEQNFYLVDNFSLGLFENYTAIDDFNAFSFGLSAGYTILHDGEAESGPAHTLLVGVGTALVKGDWDYTLVLPNYRFSYFVNERVAPYFQAGPAFYIGFEEANRTDLDISFGLALHFPTTMRVNIPK